MSSFRVNSQNQNIDDLSTECLSNASLISLDISFIDLLREVTLKDPDAPVLCFVSERRIKFRFSVGEEERTLLFEIRDEGNPSVLLRKTATGWNRFIQRYGQFFQVSDHTPYCGMINQAQDPYSNFLSQMRQSREDYSTDEDCNDDSESSICCSEDPLESSTSSSDLITVTLPSQADVESTDLTDLETELKWLHSRISRPVFDEIMVPKEHWPLVNRAPISSDAEFRVVYSSFRCAWPYYVRMHAELVQCQTNFRRMLALCDAASDQITEAHIERLFNIEEPKFISLHKKYTQIHIGMTQMRRALKDYYHSLRGRY